MKKLALLLTLPLVFVACSQKNDTAEYKTQNTTETTEQAEVLAEITPKVGKYKVETDDSRVKWTGTKVGGSHWGYVPVAGGVVLAENGISGELVFNIANLTVEDIQGDGAEGLKNHLFDEKFFNTAQFPTASLRIKEKTPTGITADLTIKETTQELTIPVKWMAEEGENDELTVAGVAKISRKAFGLAFEGPGELTVSDDMTLEFSIELEDE